MTWKDALEFSKKNGAKMVDMKFTDLLGTWQHLTIPAGQLSEDVFTEGLGFDGSSIRGWRSINNSDMVLLPDPSTAKMDPFTEVPTVSFICDIVLPESGAPYDRDPRQIAKRALAYLRSTGIADTAFLGPEAEFFIFDDVRYQQDSNVGFYQIDSEEGDWNSGSGDGPNLGYKPRPQEGYFPAMPTDTLHDIRSEICLKMEESGIPVERHHHEVGSAGQGEINFKFEEIIKIADHQQWFKYIVKNTARKHGKTATFMPKPLFGANGSGMHVHMSLWKNGKPLFAGNKYAGLSDMALHFIGGILKHAPALCAFTNPTTNSYKRLVPGYEAPIKLAYSFKNRSAAIRIPNSGDSPKAKRIEFRTPDPSANPYLAFAALIMAGIDGIQNKINPGEPLDKNIYGLPPEEAAKVPSIPASLDETFAALQKDPEFLMKGEVFSQDFIDNWTDYKTENEIRPMQQRPVPYEFFMYYDL